VQSTLLRVASIKFGARARWLLSRAALVAIAVWAIAEFGGLAQAVAEGRHGAWITTATAAVVLFSALLSSTVGFAFSAIAGSALAYFNLDPVNAVRTIVLCSCAMQLYLVWRLRASIRWRPLWPLLLSGAMTIPIGVWLLVRLNPSFYVAGLGLFLIGYGSLVLVRRETRVVRGDNWTGPVAAALGGLTGGLAGLPAASVMIWCSMRGWDKQQQRTVYQPYILGMQLMTIACLHWLTPAGGLPMRDLAYVPFALFGAMGGFALYQRMNSKQFHVATSVLLLCSGAGLLVRVF
jgi:uncharacterized membrane protein YfcA